MAPGCGEWAVACTFAPVAPGAGGGVNVGRVNVGGVNDACDENGSVTTTAPQWPQKFAPASSGLPHFAQGFTGFPSGRMAGTATSPPPRVA